MWLVVAVAVGVAVAGGAVRPGCITSSCGPEQETGSAAPFCGLDEPTRQQITAGFRDGRSPEILAIAASPVGDRSGTMWPQQGSAESYPLAFTGTGFSSSAKLDGVTFDQVAPTIANAIGLDRPFPEVRSGKAIEGITTGERPRLIIQVVLEDATTETFASPPPALGAVLSRSSITTAGDPGSLPHDPAALSTTIGTGGLPRTHGVTGSLLRNERGELVAAWSRDAPPLVIATLADDLDESTSQRAHIGYIGTSRRYLGLVGGSWYIDNDKDDRAIVPGRDIAGAAREILRSGYGTDDVTDLLAIVIPGSSGSFDPVLQAVLAKAERVAPGRWASTIVGLGGGEVPPTARMADSLEEAVEKDLGANVIEATTPGGVFLDQEVLAAQELSDDKIIRSLMSRDEDGRPVFEDVFSSTAVRFGKYC
jgi:hypothetical protein